MTFFTFNINPEQITQFINYGFYALIAILVIAFFVGYIHGIWREGFRLIFVGGMVVFSVIFTRYIVNFFMDIDVSQLASNAGMGMINFEVNGMPVIVSVTTPYLTIEALLEQGLLAFGVPMTANVTELVVGLTLVILRYVLFIILAIFIFLFGDFLADLLYFFPFRYLIPRHFRKKVKLRILGGFASATKVFLVMAMFLSPFTSLVNTVSKSFEKIEDNFGTEIDAALFSDIMSYVDAYNDSTFAQTLFSWSITDDGLSIDTALMNYVTGQDIDNYRLTLANELGVFMDIAATIVASGAVDGSLSVVDSSLLISEDVITNLFASITGSTLLMKILPIAVSIGLNAQEVESFLDPSLINLDQIVWEEELDVLEDIFLGVARSGVLTPVLQGENNAAILNAIFSEIAAPEVSSILSSLDASPFMSQVIPAVLFQLVQNEIDQGGPGDGLGFSSFLPTTWSEYESIQFGSELSIIYNLVYQLSSEIDGFFDIMLGGGLPGSPAQPFPLRRINETSNVTSPFELVANHFDLFVEVMIGEVNQNGLPINNDPITGKSINKTALLDSDLIVRALPSIMNDLLLPSLVGFAGESFDDTSLNTLIASFNSGTQGDVRLSYKGEFAGILSILSAVASNESLLSILEPSGAGFDLLGLLGDQDFRSGFKNDFVPKLDNSQIVLTIVPEILRTALLGAGFEDFLSLISLAPEDLNFEFTSLSRELNIIIDLMGYATSVLNASDDLLNEFPNVAYDLIGLLDSIYASDIINLNPISNNKTTNYNQIIKGIFTLVGGIGIDEDDLDAGFNRVVPIGLENGWTTTFTDTNGNGQLDANDAVVYAGENYNLVTFLSTALDSGILDIEGDIFEALEQLTSGSEDLNDPNVSILYKVFAHADRSEIISSSFGGILDNLFGSTGGLLDEDLGTSFRNVTSWAEEGSTLIYLVKQMNNFSGGIGNIDFLNSDVSMIEELLQGLAASQIFVKSNGDYLFPEYLLNQLTGISSLSTYFNDPTPYQITYDQDPNDSLTLITADFEAVGNNEQTRHLWFGEKELIKDNNNNPILDANGNLQYEYVGGEIEHIVNFIDAIQNTSISDLTNGTNLNASTIENVLLSLNEASSLRVLLYNIYDSIFSGSSFNIGSLSMSDTNTFVFLELNQLQRAHQIEATADLIQIIDEVGLANGGTFDIANFDETTILKVGDLLDTLHGAALFNSFKVGQSRSQGDLTVFEQTYQFLLTTSTLDTFVYDGLNASQKELAIYQDIIRIQNNFGLGHSDGWSGSQGEIQKFVDIMVSFEDLGINFADFSGAGASNTLSNFINTSSGLAKIESLLLAMNDSSIIYPAIPNLFSTILGGGNFSSISGLDFNQANFRYRGNRNDPTNPSPDARYLPYDSLEISVILDIFSEVNIIGNRSYNNISSLTNESIDEVASLVTSLHDSQVFHLSGPASQSNTDLTIFEQMMVKMFVDTGMADLAYDPTRSADTAYGNANLKAEDLVLRFDNLFPVNNATHLTDRWLDHQGKVGEINAFFRIFKELKVALPSVGSASTIDASSLSPDAISRILSALNYSSLTSDAVKTMVKDAFVGISFGTYTENNETYELTPTEFILEDLNTMNYASLPGTITNQGLIHNLLGSFYDPGINDYISISAGFDVSEFLDDGGSLTPLVKLLNRSLIFGNDATNIIAPSASQPGSQPVSVPGNYKTRSITFYNFLNTANVGKYFAYLTSTNTDKEIKVTRIEQIFSNNFDEQFESERLDDYIATLSFFTNLTSAAGIQQYSSEMRQLIELTYLEDNGIIIDRAFFVSELSAGFFTDIFSPEYGNSSPHEFSTHFSDPSNLNLRLNFYDRDKNGTLDFDLLNPIEADGIEGALSFLNILASLQNNNPPGIPNTAQINAMKAAFVKMGSRSNLLVPGQPWPIQSDYSTWSNANISNIAQLFYASQVVSNSAFVSFNTTVQNLTANPRFNTSLLTKPYSTNFVFEIEGEKISYAFEV